jgi:hypothetical protein
MNCNAIPVIILNVIDAKVAGSILDEITELLN